jgi:hypothetical protein
METKPFYLSKTFWVNLVGLFWTFGAGPLGLPTLSEDTMLSILAVINILLRFITKTEVSLTKQE